MEKVLRRAQGFTGEKVMSQEPQYPRIEFSPSRGKYRIKTSATKLWGYTACDFGGFTPYETSFLWLARRELERAKAHCKPALDDWQEVEESHYRGSCPEGITL